MCDSQILKATAPLLAPSCGIALPTPVPRYLARETRRLLGVGLSSSQNHAIPYQTSDFSNDNGGAVGPMRSGPTDWKEGRPSMKG
jgi:hypothetical protein